MKEKLKIDIVSDVVCPWCVIGYKRLNQAITDLNLQDNVEVEWQPFELNPTMPEEGQELGEHIFEKYGSSPEQQEESHDYLSEMGSEVGFEFDYFEGMKIVNTRSAHILMEFAKEHGLQTQLKMRLMEAFFTERKDVSNLEILIQEAKSIGLDSDLVRARLEDDSARQQLMTKEGQWKRRGVSAVPTVVFNGESALTGAHPVDVYKQVLTELMDQKK